MGGLSGLSGLKGLSGLRSNLDPDAQRFFTEADITDATQRMAVNNLVVGKKANGTWSKYHAIYPLVGGTASRHSYNLKNPATFQITWAGGVTHDSNGVTGNGTTGTGNTGYSETVNSVANSIHLSCYSRTNSSLAATDIGVRDNGSYTSWLSLRWTNDLTYYEIQGDNFNTNISNSTGLYVTSRTASNLTTLYRNGVFSASRTPAPAGSNAGTYRVLSADGKEYSTRNYAMFTIGLGLTSAEAAADYTTIQAYQTALGRQV